MLYKNFYKDLKNIPHLSYLTVQVYPQRILQRSVKISCIKSILENIIIASAIPRTTELIIAKILSHINYLLQISIFYSLFHYI